jgi:predicted N-acyltransferase
MEAIDALADVIYRISRAEKLRGKIAAVLVKDFYQSSIEHTREFEEYKYHDFLVEPNMMMDIQWNTFEEYLNAMSKKYRNRAKNIVKKGAEIERRDFSEKDILENSERILQLYRNVHLKAKFRMASLTLSYFAEMKKVLAGKFSFIAYFFEGKMIGFRTTFVLKNEIEAHFIGLDYSVNKELELYQNILYDYVQEALQNRSHRLLLGRTASEIKSTVGAEAVELTCYIRHRNPLSNRIIKPFVDFLKPSDWVPRNPFKEISI